MCEQGAALQTYNLELVKCLEDMKGKKSSVAEKIRREEANKLIVEKNIRELQSKLSGINRRLTYHRNLQAQFDSIIREAEDGFKKILESSQTLLQVVQQQTSKIESSPNPLFNIPQADLKDVSNSNATWNIKNSNIDVFDTNAFLE